MVGSVATDRRTKTKYTITGPAPDGGWVLQPLEFDSPISVSTADLRRHYGLKDAEAYAPVDERTGWNRFADRWRRTVELNAAQRSAVEAPTPEAVFSGEASGQAEAWAQTIWNSPEKLGAYEIGASEPACLRLGLSRSLDR